MSRKLLLQAYVLDFLRQSGAGDAAELAQKTWAVPEGLPVVRTRNSFLLDWWLQMWKTEGMRQKDGRHASPHGARGQGQASSSDPPSIAGPQQRPGQCGNGVATPRKPSPHASSSQEQLSVSRGVNSPSPCLPSLRVDSRLATSSCKHHIDSGSSALVTSPLAGSPLVGSSGVPPSRTAADAHPAARQVPSEEHQPQQPPQPQQHSQQLLGPMSPLQKHAARLGRKASRRGLEDPAAVALLARYAAATAQKMPTLAEVYERAAARGRRRSALPRRERQQAAGDTDTDTDEAWGEDAGASGAAASLRPREQLQLPKRMREGWGKVYGDGSDCEDGEGGEEEDDSDSGGGKRRRRERPPPGSYAQLAAIRFHQRRGGQPRSAAALRMQQRRQRAQQEAAAQLHLMDCGGGASGGEGYAQQDREVAAGCPSASPASLADFPDIPEDLLALGDPGCFDLFPSSHEDMAAEANWELAAGGGNGGGAGAVAACVSDLEGVFDDPLDVLLPLAGPPCAGALPLAW